MVRLTEIIALGAVAALAIGGTIGLQRLFSSFKNPFEGIEFPSFGDITFPSFNLPDVNISNDLGSVGSNIAETIRDGFRSLPGVDSGFTSEPADQEFIDAPAQGEPFEGAEIRQDEKGRVFVNGVQQEGNEVIPRGQNFVQAETLFPPDNTPIPRSEIDGITETPNVTSGIENQQFEGGGPSFIGGTVRDIPISNMSLSDIIERFNVGATENADIRARARDDFGDFDFGTNRGLGIGSVIPEIPEITSQVPEFGSNVSDPNFEGLSAQEIAQRLTGGNISNF